MKRWLLKENYLEKRTENPKKIECCFVLKMLYPESILEVSRTQRKFESVFKIQLKIWEKSEFTYTYVFTVIQS